MIYDILIIGAGPAGLSAGIYAARAGFSCLVFEKLFPGGQAAKTDIIENYPGINSITGIEFAMQMQQHAAESGAVIESGEITKIDVQGDVKEVHSGDKVYKSKTIIIATGAVPRKLGLESELRLAARGVSYCATCDGNFFRGKDIAVIGGGDSAVEEALYLANLVNKVYIVHRRDEFRAKQYLVDKIKANEKVEIVWDSTLSEIQGEDNVTGVILKNKNTQELREIPLSAVFVSVGMLPESEFVKDVVDINENGYILTDENLQTNIPGVFAAGDVRKKTLRQIVTAASDGATCITSIEHYLNEQ